MKYIYARGSARRYSPIANNARLNKPGSITAPTTKDTNKVKETKDSVFHHAHLLTPMTCLLIQKHLCLQARYSRRQEIA